MFFTNKHVVIAMIVAPILAIIAWFAVGYFVSEPPQPPQAGKSYKLAAKPNCRWESGQCDLWNGNFEIHLEAVPLADGSLDLRLKSSFPLQGAKVAVVPDGSEDAPPLDMNREDFTHTRWFLRMETPPRGEDRLRMALKMDDSFYYVDTSTRFFHREQPDWRKDGN